MTSIPIGFLCASTALVTASCGDERGDAIGVDASVPVDAAWGPDAGLTITAPAIPWLDDGVPALELGSCPDGWREVPPTDEHGVTTCDPYPEAGAADCAANEAHFPGEPGCSRIGTACPTDGWPEDLPRGRTVIYVRADAAAGGDGTSPATAFDRLADATRAATAGTVIAIGVGEYDEPVRLGAGVTLWGACVAGTRLGSSELHEYDAVVTVNAADTEVRNLRIEGAARMGVLAFGAGTTIRLLDIVVSGVQRVGVAVLAGAHLQMTGALVEDTRVWTDGTYGVGFWVNGSEADVRRAVLRRNRTQGVYAGLGAMLHLTDAVVRDTEEGQDAAGRGLEAQSGAEVEVARTLFERNRDVGVVAGNEGTVVRLTDTIVRDTLPGGMGRNGIGLGAADGAELDVGRTLITRNRSAGLLGTGEATVVRLLDVAVLDTMERTSDGLAGRGIELVGATTELVRILISRSRSAAVYADAAGAMMLTDVVIRDTRPRASDSVMGRALHVQGGVDADVVRALFEGNREISVFADGDETVLTLADLIVRDTLPQEAGGLAGAGLLAQFGARVGGERVALRENRMAGVASTIGATVTLEDLEVRDTLPARCAETICPELEGGFGVSAHYEGASLSLTRFVVSQSALCAAAVGTGGEVDLADGVLEGAPIGACVQVDGYDAGRLMTNVRYIDVGVPLQATSYVLPAPVEDPSSP